MGAAESGLFTKETVGEKSLYHRSHDPDLLSHVISAETPRASKQSRKGATVGFYAYESLESGQHFGDNVFEITVPSGTLYLDLVGSGINTSRIDPVTASQLRDMGIKAILGKDYVGPPEWIIISDDLVRGIRPYSTSSR